MSEQLEKLQAVTGPAMQFLEKYANYIVFIILGVILGTTIMLAANVSSSTPSQTVIDEKLVLVKKPKIDEKALQQIEQLQDQNVEVKTLFDEARQNPFSE